MTVRPSPPALIQKGNLAHHYGTAKKNPNINLYKTSSITTASICTKCGKLAIEGICNNAVEGPVPGRNTFDRENVPTETATAISNAKSAVPAVPWLTTDVRLTRCTQNLSAKRDIPDK